jgi:hypothetical protein
VATRATLSRSVAISLGCVLGCGWDEMNTTIGLSVQQLKGLSGDKRADTLGMFHFPGSWCH